MKKKGFFAALFDLSFSEFVTTRLIRLLYVIKLVAAGLCIVGGVVLAFLRGPRTGILALVLAPVAFLLAAIAARVLMELLIVVFRIAEHTGETAKAVKE